MLNVVKLTEHKKIGCRRDEFHHLFKCTVVPMKIFAKDRQINW